MHFIFQPAEEGLGGAQAMIADGLIGNGAGEGSCEVHNPGYDFNDEALPLGATVFARIVETRLSR